MALEYFPCYHSYIKKCEKLTDQELGRLFRALMIYSETGGRQELAGRESIAFDFIADDIDRAKESYEERCRTNRENGKKAAQQGRSVPTGTDRGRTVPNAPQSKDKSKDKSNTPSPNGDRSNARASVSAAYLDKINPSASQLSIDQLGSFADEMGQEVCLRAMDIALDNKTATWPYIRGILSKWQVLGVKCLADIDRLDKKPERTANESKRGGKSIPGWGDTDRSVDKAMLRDMAELDMILKGEEGG